MKIFTGFKLACFGLWSNRFRILSAMMGVVIGMFAVIVLTAIAIGVKDTLLKQMGSLGAEQILVIARKGARYGKRSKGFAQRTDELA